MRLTNKIREELRLEVLRDAAKDRLQALRDRESLLAHEALLYAIGEKDMEVYDKIPKGWLETTYKLTVWAKKTDSTGKSHNVKFDGRSPAVSRLLSYGSPPRSPFPCRELSSHIALRVPNCILYEPVVFESGTPQAKALLALNQDWNDFYEQMAALSTKVGDLTAGCKTDKQLLDLWPEVSPFLTRALNKISPPQTQPLVVRAEDLSKAFKCAKTGEGCK